MVFRLSESRHLCELTELTRLFLYLQGIRIRINKDGDIFVTRLSKANVYVRQMGRHVARDDRGDGHMLLKGSHSSSDVYAAHSETNSDFYGVAKTQTGVPHRRHLIPVSQGPKKNKLRSVSTSASSSSSDNLTALNNIPSSSYLHAGAEGNKWPSLAMSQLELDKLAKIFDMQSFKCLLEREARRSHPDRNLLRNMCISVVSFVLDDKKMLNLPCWILVINIVALDLIKTEVGLVDPYDLMNYRPIDRDDYHHLEDHENLNYTYETERKSYSLKAAASLQALNNQKRLLSASKRAFATAAASGAYNGDYYSASNDNFSYRNESSQDKKINTQLFSPDQTKKMNQEIQDEQSKKRQQTQHAASSSSSGFNSHCSSQTDSSAASSRSNIAANEKLGSSSSSSSALQPTGVVLREQSDSSSSCQMGSSNMVPVSGGPDLVPTRPVLPPKNKSRGKRPPKIPHGIAPGAGIQQSGPVVSDPIEIPAPPTGAGAPATGKANLILVSPTGLSPPMSKRKSCDGSNSRLILSPVGEGVACGKHAGDENGQCQVWLDDHESSRGQQQHKLPAGIPAHAQLAPPSTRKHILRYLLSSSSSDAEKPNRSLLMPPPPPRRQRPLPVLPVQRPMRFNCNPGYLADLNRSDESLYYCGRQARVPNQQRRPGPPLPPPMYPVTKNAIEAILTDFKMNQLHNQLRQRSLFDQQRLIRPAPSTTNLMKSSGKFTSVDNLGKCSSSSACSSLCASRRGIQSNSGGPNSSKMSFLNHVGAFLKRTKVKPSVGAD